MSEEKVRPAMRDVARRAVQAEIASAALRLFLERGFDETTVDNIAAVPHVESRLKGTTATRRLKAEAIVSCALPCLKVAAPEWTRMEGSAPLGGLFDQAMAVVRT